MQVPKCMVSKCDVRVVGGISKPAKKYLEIFLYGPHQVID